MERDALFFEPIVWRGAPVSNHLPLLCRAGTLVGIVGSLVALSFAVLVSRVSGASPTNLLVSSAWMASVALLCWKVPLIWRAGVEYCVTENHVIWRRGGFSRSISREAISYARIHWDDASKKRGDLVLVRTIPTGSLGQTLTIRLSGIDAPDRLWQLIRGEASPASIDPESQNEESGERVLWTAKSHAATWNIKRITLAFGSVVMVATAVRMWLRFIPLTSRVIEAQSLSVGLAAIFILAVAMSIFLASGVALAFVYAAFFAPVRAARGTRYTVTDKRVIIQRGNSELLLDRAKISYVVQTTSGRLHDLFLIIDRPNARALIASGAIVAGGDSELSPALLAIDDPSVVSAILSDSPPPHRV